MSGNPRYLVTIGLTGEHVLVDAFNPLATESMPAQLHRNDWTGKYEVIRHAGFCVTCHRPVWDRDGDNDPRGVLGDNALSALTAQEYEMTGPDVAQCAICANDHDSYKAGLEIARSDYWTSES